MMSHMTLKVWLTNWDWKYQFAITKSYILVYTLVWIATILYTAYIFIYVDAVDVVGNGNGVFFLYLTDGDFGKFVSMYEYVLCVYCQTDIYTSIYITRRLSVLPRNSRRQCPCGVATFVSVMHESVNNEAQHPNTGFFDRTRIDQKLCFKQNDILQHVNVYFFFFEKYE